MLTIQARRYSRLILLSLPVHLLVSSCSDPIQPPEQDAGSAVASAPIAAEVGRTRIAIDGARFRINAALTYPGQPAEGKLMNVRMVNAVFEDLGRPQFNSASNTDEFVSRMREYVSLGARAFTVSLQGGYPGYEGAVNSAFLANGDLKSGYLARVARVIEKADALGAVILLSLYYQRQDQYLRDERAVRSGVVNVVDWIRRKGYRNVVLEIANEYGHRGFNHAILRSDDGVASLIRLAKDKLPSLYVSASYVANGRATPKVVAASDLILTHFNVLSISDIPARVRALKTTYPNKPIVCNEDDRTGSQAAAAARASVGAGASYGLMLNRNQHYPFYFQGRQDDPAAYGEYIALTR
ncbi:MAG: hypothetical protein H0T68_08715 [Gemmatimonadales bacterium]|nr:hypothetical protein [Gemmatimonadales bacterium]